MKLGYIGLGKMGTNMVERLLEHKHTIVVYDKNPELAQQFTWKGVEGMRSSWNLIDALGHPCVIWLMVPHETVDEVLNEIVPILRDGDTIIDGGNSFYKDSMRRAKDLAQRYIRFLDVGVSGGPEGARHGACLMIGGERSVYDEFEHLFRDIAAENAYGYFGPAGAGHFVKMVHNGIEYGMMQAIAEGFEVLKQSPYGFQLGRVADLYNHKSVIESRLVGWLKEAYEAHGEDLASMSGSVRQSGEGAWTVETAKEFGVPVSVLEQAVEFRNRSQENPRYAGKILTALRNKFGGHATQ